MILILDFFALLGAMICFVRSYDADKSFYPLKTMTCNYWSIPSLQCEYIEVFHNTNSIEIFRNTNDICLAKNNHIYSTLPCLHHRTRCIRNLANGSQNHILTDIIFQLLISYNRHQFNGIVGKFALEARICVWQGPIVNSIAIISVHVIGNGH